MTRAMVRLELGGTLRRLHGFGTEALDGRIAVGARTRVIGHYFTTGFVWGETGEHLRTYALTFGYNLELYPAELLRVGFGIEPGMLWVHRASYDGRLFSPGINVFAHGGLDLVKLGGRYQAMYLDLRVQGGLYIKNTPFWGPTLSLGFRF